MEKLSYFIGRWYWEDIPRENVVERVLLFPVVITLMVGGPILALVGTLHMFIFPEDFTD